MPDRDQHVLDRLGAAFAEREIVFARAALVAVAFDRDRDVRIAPQPIGLSRQDLLRLGRDIGAVEGEEHAVAGTRLQILLRSRHDVSRADAAGPARPARRPPGRPAPSRGALLQAASSSKSAKMPISLHT